MKILLIGSGGRENALAYKLTQSRHKPELFFAPGNPGMAQLGQRLDIDVLDIQGLTLFAQREGIDLTVVGPEAPLAAGITDSFQEAGLKIFGPNRAGAQLEASKAFAKELMAEAGIPTAGYRHCQMEAEALSALQIFTSPYVIKEDGLAAGKGVTIATDKPEADEAIARAFAKGMSVVLEEFMPGEELSILALCDGKTALPMVGAQDFKRVGEGDTGPNTGGMGAYAPVPMATPVLLARVQAEVLNPALQALRNRGIDYRGVLYAGLMIGPDGAPRVVEFNVRFGDPETQAVVPLLADDLVDLMLACCEGALAERFPQGIRFQDNTHAVTVVLASEGYPDTHETGKPLFFPDFLPPSTMIFHAGTKLLPDKTIVSNGGRVLTVTSLGSRLSQARERAYEAARMVKFENRYFRPDIAMKAANAETRQVHA